MGTDSDDLTTYRRTFLATTGSTAVTGLVAGCSSGGESGGESGTATSEQTKTDTSEAFEVTITQGTMPTTLDPHDHRDIPTDIAMLQSYEGLLSRTAEGEITAMLATDWERVEAGHVRFTIRDGPTFHKTGNELTPEDVAYSINRIVDDDIGFTSPQAGQLSGVTGAEVADDGRAVDVYSDGFNPIVFSEFAIYCDVVEKAWVQDNEKSYVAQHMNGTGPFEQTDYEQNQSVEFERYDDYWREPASVSHLTIESASDAGVRVNQLVAGETDLVVNVPPESFSRVENSEASVETAGSTRVIYNAMKATVEPFSSPKFRRAMNYAVDLESIIESALKGAGGQTGQPTLEPFFGYNEDTDPYPHDPEKAERLVEESGHAGVSIELHTPVGRYLKDLQIARLVADMIDELPNVSCSVKQRTFSTLAGELTDSDITTGPDFYLIGWGNATFDASQTINPTLTSDGSLTSWKNDDLDQLIEDANSTTDTDKREQLLREANQLCHDDAPWIFLNRQYGVYGTSDRVEWTARNDERIDAYAISPAQ
ncbi:ABC transporter substrate-binding protein [Haloarcula argentinensis]|uniref:Peptide ABC transporter substrate-binding protein n=1 Tax=Haloarcula argentinensis TaxID=43776 RepID=A0A847UJP5_HALAR|nr:ABC transporter substrate-binding protein [Haloarcula argentinensis]NLV11864.1 peptide ABC transporter substrate-binding protein [Haloarcula argentinensis]